MRTTLRDGEEVILKVEKHWVVLVKSWCIFTGSVILLIAALISSSQLAKNFFSSVFGMMVFAGLYLWYAIAERRVDIWVVTNLRVIDESGIITHQAKESPLDKINNIQYRQTVAGRLLDFGDVEIQTAAEQGETINRFVSHPKKLHDTVVGMQGQLKDVDHRTRDRRMNESILIQEDQTECPFCAEVVKKKAKVCKHCGKELMPESVEPESRILLSDSVASGSELSISMQQEDPGANPRDWLKEK